MRYIITETQLKNLKIRRNIHKIPLYVRSAYEWLNPKTFKSFEDFKNRVLFSSTRDFASDYTETSEDYESTKSFLAPHFVEVIDGILHSEILDYYNENTQ